MTNVRVEYDEASEDKRVLVRLTPPQAELVEYMFVVAYAACHSFLQARRGNQAKVDEYRRNMAEAMHVMLANGETAKEVREIITAVHVELHHPGKTCDEALEEHGGEAPETWRGQ